MIVIYYAGVQHVFMETDIVRNEALGIHAFQEGTLEAVPESIRESAPTRVHILDSNTFFGPLSSFMRRLQCELGIESDVSLEFESMALSVPINMSFAESDLSLAHIYAIAATLCEEGAENAAPILTASLVVAPTNFVRKYNELVHTFKSKRSLKISSGKTVKPILRPTQSQSPDATQMITDETTGTTGSRSRSDSSASSASSTWSQLAVCDTASLAVLSDSEALTTESSRRSPFLNSSTSGARLRKSLTSSTGNLFSGSLGPPALSRHLINPAHNFAPTPLHHTPGHGLNHHLVHHIGPLPHLSDSRDNNASSSAPPRTASSTLNGSTSSASASPSRPSASQLRSTFLPAIDPMFRMLDDTESLSVSNLQNVASPALNRSSSPSSRPAPLRHFASTGGLYGVPIIPAASVAPAAPAPQFSDLHAATNALSASPVGHHSANRKRPREFQLGADPQFDSANEEVADYPPKRKVDTLTPHEKPAQN